MRFDTAQTHAMAASTRSRRRRKHQMSEIMTKTRSGSARILDHVDHFWQHGYAVVRGLFFKSEMGEIQVESRRVY